MGAGGHPNDNVLRALCSSYPAAQRGHRQALFTASGAMRASASGLISAVRHQQSVSKLPVSAGAHWLAPPHSGQVRLGSGAPFISKGRRWLFNVNVLHPLYRSASKPLPATYRPTKNITQAIASLALRDIKSSSFVNACAT